MRYGLIEIYLIVLVLMIVMRIENSTYLNFIFNTSFILFTVYQLGGMSEHSCCLCQTTTTSTSITTVCLFSLIKINGK